MPRYNNNSLPEAEVAVNQREELPFYINPNAACLSVFYDEQNFTRTSVRKMIHLKTVLLSTVIIYVKE